MTTTDSFDDLFVPIHSLDQLYGRGHLLQQLLRLLTDTRKPQSVQLVGLPLTGKTSLLQVLSHLQEASNDPLLHTLKLRPGLLKKHIFVLVTLEDIQPFTISSFWRSLGQQLTRVLRSHHYEISRQDEGIIDSSDKLMSVLDMLLLKSFTVVFLFDDFDQMIDRIPHQILYQLRAILELRSPSSPHNKVLSVVASQQVIFGTGKRQHERNGLSYLAPLFGRPLYLGLLEEERGEQDADAFLQMLCRKGNLLPDDQKLLRTLGGRHPYFTLVAYKHLVVERWRNIYLTNAQHLEQEIQTEVGNPYQPVLAALSQAQQTALTSIVRGINAAVSDAVWNELLALGLIVHNTTGMMRYALCSPLLSALLQAEEGKTEVGTSIFDLQVWPEQRALQLPGQPPKVLSPTEWRLFAYLRKHAGQVCSREELFETLYDDEDTAINDALLDTIVSRLRQKIDTDIGHSRITTIRGKGYRFELLASSQSSSSSLIEIQEKVEERARNILEQYVRVGNTAPLPGKATAPESKQAAYTLGSYTGKLVTDLLVSALEEAEQGERIQPQPLNELTAYLDQLQNFVKGLLRH